MALAQALMMGYRPPPEPLEFVGTEVAHETSTNLNYVDVSISSSALSGDLLIINGATRIPDSTAVSAVDSNSNAATLISSYTLNSRPNFASFYLLHDGSATSIRLTFTAASSDTLAARCSVFRPDSFSTVSVAGQSIERRTSAVSASLSGLAAAPNPGVRLAFAAACARPEAAGFNDTLDLSLTSGASGWSFSNNDDEIAWGYLVESAGTAWTDTTVSGSPDETQQVANLFALDLT